MSDADGATVLEVDLSAASIAKLTKAISDAVAQGGAQGWQKTAAAAATAGKKAGKTFADEWAHAFKANSDQIQRALNSVIDKTKTHPGMSALDSQQTRALSYQIADLHRLSAAIIDPKIIKAMAAEGDGVLRAFLEGVKKQSSAAWLSVQQLTNRINQESRERTATIKADGALAAKVEANSGRLVSIEARKNADILTRQARVAGEMQLNDAKTTSKLMVDQERAASAMRVASRKAAMKMLVDMERLGVSAVKGLASTTTSVLSRMASSTASLFHRSNSDVTSGLSAAYDKRERIMRSSFSQQEGIMRRSAERQAMQMDAMRRQTSTGVMGAITGRGIGMGLGALVGGIGVISWLKSGYTEAINLNEQLNKTRVVFGAMSDDVIAFASNSVNALGATKAETLTAAATFGNLFRSVKLSEQQSAGMSTTLVQLASDLSSFNNVPIGDVFDALRSGLVGEQEPLRRLGVNLNEMTLKAKALELGLSDGKSVLDANAKAQAAYALIMEQTTLAQGDFARTMYEGANAQRRAGKAAQELAASIMGKLRPAMTAMMNGAVVVFTGLTALLTDQTNPALHVLQRVLGGVAVGMGAIIAMKGAVEVIRLLGVAFKMALGPMGLVLIAAGAIGGAVSLMMDRSAAFRETVGRLGAKLREVGGIIHRALQPVLDRVSRFVDERIIPAFDRFANFVGENLIGALSGAARMISGAFGSAMRTVVPLIERAGDSLASLFSRIAPYLEPAIAGMKALGAGVRGAFGGDFSGLGSGLSQAGAGILSSLTMIAGRVGEALAPVAKKVGEFITGLFSGPNLKRYAKAILGFVEMVGRLLGTLVTSPTFLKVVAGIAAAAVVIGFKFVQGLIEGVISNLPALWRMVTDALATGFVAAFKAAWHHIIPTIGIILASAFVVPKLFSRFGGEAANSFVSGVKTRMSTGVTLARSFFDPKIFAAQATKAGLDAKLALSNTIKSNNRILTTAGQGAINAVMKGFYVSPAEMKRVTGEQSKALSTLKGQLGEAGYAALEARAKMIAFANVMRGWKGDITGVHSTFTTLRAEGQSAFKALGSAFGDLWTSMKITAEREGMSVGQVMGMAIKGGVTAALAGLGGFMAGKAEGQGGGSGIMSALTAGLTGFAVTGSPIVGAVAAGMGLIGAAFGRASKAAEEFRAKVVELSNEMRDGLNKAIEEGAIGLDDLSAKTIGFQTIGAISDMKASLVEALGPTGRQLVADFSISVERDLIPALEAAGSDGAKAVANLSNAFIDAAVQAGKVPASVANALKYIARPGGASASDFTDAARLRDASGGNTDVERWIRNNSAFVKSLLQGQEALAGQAKALSAASQDALNYRKAMMTPGEASAARMGFESVADAVTIIAGGMFRSGKTIKEVNDYLKTVGLPQVDATGTVKSYVAADVAASQALAAHEALVLALSQPLPTPGVSDFKRAFSDAVLAVQSSGETLAELLANQNLSPLALEAQRVQLKDQVTTAWSTAVAAGIKDGSISTLDELNAVLLQLAGETADGGGAAGAAFTTEMLNALGPGFRNLLAAQMHDIGMAIPDGLLAGVLDGQGKLFGWLNIFDDEIVKTVKGGLQMKSPSKVMRGIGRNVADSMALGIREGMDGVAAVASRMASVTAGAASLPSAGAGGRPAAGGYGTSVTKTQTNTNNIYLPTGDPHAAALAVANRQASSLWG